MDDFRVLVQSVGEQIVDGIGRDRLERVAVVGDDRISTAEVEITLSDNSWDEQQRAIDKMIDVRGMFLGEVSISYCFLDGVTSSDDRSVVDARLLCVSA